jgi:hypothetical protein
VLAFIPDALRQILEAGAFYVEEICSCGNRTAVIGKLFWLDTCLPGVTQEEQLGLSRCCVGLARRPG